MSLEKRTILDKTINDLMEESWKLALFCFDLWKVAMHDREKPPEELLLNIKKLAEQVKVICDELPV